MLDPDSTLTSRGRLMTAGKTLFARNGYEQTSTAAIAREAGTSESQLVRYFEGKAGLLDAIFNESWKPLNEKVEQIGSSSSGRQAVLEILALLIDGLATDRELARLFLFEERRMRGSQDVVISEGFARFVYLLRQVIQRGQRDGTFRHEFHETALAAALMGAAEGMIRERITAERAGREDPFGDTEISNVFKTMVEAL
ncbi:MAG TPA: TetR/AcrR family transcriptional regulator [Thermoanaerobaculia bacterium]|nr:TetR/AcrR family transcriptional regulator [Thermoanaerobaculia bacterium]